ncbi:hypothetical protein LGH82_18215 [Mesorhizobium sp. PAMC28654]|uniref:hypothetical protein n=1 Tax=Mesorhizobium sp. PAMC28654 TaxID=2880934 RepID=UPI001D0ABEF2|nr:hypothetical protein [Mesorhizobium sp. PAMC28654]UDL87137.1 hypothetical protein LGH82_18215 [Mesorhizobium sp. PAMC28654]
MTILSVRGENGQIPIQFRLEVTATPVAWAASPEIFAVVEKTETKSRAGDIKTKHM